MGCKFPLFLVLVQAPFELQIYEPPEHYSSSPVLQSQKEEYMFVVAGKNATAKEFLRMPPSRSRRL